ncbi:hypothetical protein [Paucisalibacillus sp. EB02]|uniref:hypothetical protein n=1 Tax=Paucisalibacillus sp. EB02 TaxID=1347087 RepID=UPI0004B14808|nr:hypothetical protein [Paucisalibacillus sp. EB02]
MTASISLWETYLIETLRSKGMSSANLLEHLKNEDSKGLNELDDSYDYTELISASKKDFSNLEQAITSDYTIKYVSVYGIKNLLGLKFGLHEGQDYQMEDTKFYGVSLPSGQVKTLETMLIHQWRLVNRKTINQDLIQVDIVHKTEISK